MMDPIRISSKTIAALAGVSQSTVSRVLNGHPNVRDATRHRVLSVIESLNYVPNSLARSLVTGKTGVIGLVTSNIVNPFFPEFIAEITTIADQHDLSVILCNTYYDPLHQAQYVRKLIEHRVDGIIFTTIMTTDTAVADLSRKAFPLVFVNRYHPRVRADTVVIDNYDGAIKAVNHFLNLGHHRIAYVRGILDSTTNRDRERGYRDALRQAGIPLRRRDVLDGDFTLEGAYNAGTRFATMEDRATAVLCADDHTAFGFLNALSDHRLHVPGDVAVIGFDDVLQASFRAIGLTTVRQPVYEMARIAMDLLLDRIGGHAPKHSRLIVLPAELVIRRTCGANPAWPQGEFPATPRQSSFQESREPSLTGRSASGSEVAR
jgi:LacI family transcriptional regulator